MHYFKRLSFEAPQAEALAALGEVASVLPRSDTNIAPFHNSLKFLGFLLLLHNDQQSQHQFLMSPIKIGHISELIVDSNLIYEDRWDFQGGSGRLYEDSREHSERKQGGLDLGHVVARMDL
jgi:hypothetical protein